jgi:hypothetical protein
MHFRHFILISLSFYLLNSIPKFQTQEDPDLRVFRQSGPDRTLLGLFSQVSVFFSTCFSSIEISALLIDKGVHKHIEPSRMIGKQ